MVKMTEKLCKELGGEWYKHHTDYGRNACVGIKLRNAKIPEADLFDVDLYKADLSGAWLEKANLSNADLEEANLYKAYLWRSNFSEAQLGNANFFNANLIGANLSNAELTAVKLNEEAVKSLFMIYPYLIDRYKKQVEKNKELIKQELLLSGV